MDPISGWRISGGRRHHLVTVTVAEQRQVQVSREEMDQHCTLLKLAQGFVEFHLLKGPEADDHTLNASRCGKTVPRLEAWTKSEAFRAAHNPAEDNKPLLSGSPAVRGFEVRQTVGHGKTAEWHEYKLQPQFCYEHHGAIDTLRLEQ